MGCNATELLSSWIPTMPRSGSEVRTEDSGKKMEECCFSNTNTVSVNAARNGLRSRSALWVARNFQIESLVVDHSAMI